MLITKNLSFGETGYIYCVLAVCVPSLRDV